VSLQGTLDTFALQDVLRLLASTSKTGHLRVRGPRGTGGIWVVDGKIVAAASESAGPSPTAVEVAFDLLRATDGAFVFDTGATSLDPGEPAEVGPIIDEAEKLLEEWRAIEAVVPSLGHWVSLAEELPSDSVPVSRSQWKVIGKIGDGRTVGALGEALGQGELAVSRSVKELMELGFASLQDRGDVWPAVAPSRLEAAAPAGKSAPAAPEAPVKETPPRAGGAMRSSGPARSGGANRGAGQPPAGQPAPAGKRLDPTERTAAKPPAKPAVPAAGRPAAARPAASVARPAAGRPESGTTAPASRDSGETPAVPAVEDPELARQLADLGPVAAAAVVAAADAETPEEAEAALDGIQGDDGEPLNRGMLLKFLSSVRT
jgi:hypothetical protein